MRRAWPKRPRSSTSKPTSQLLIQFVEPSDPPPLPPYANSTSCNIGSENWHMVVASTRSDSLGQVYPFVAEHLRIPTGWRNNPSKLCLSRPGLSLATNCEDDERYQENVRKPFSASLQRLSQIIRVQERFWNTDGALAHNESAIITFRIERSSLFYMTI